MNSDLQAVMAIVPAVPTAADLEDLRAAWRDAAKEAGYAWHLWCASPSDQASLGLRGLRRRRRPGDDGR